MKILVRKNSTEQKKNAWRIELPFYHCPFMSTFEYEGDIKIKFFLINEDRLSCIQ